MIEDSFIDKSKCKNCKNYFEKDGMGYCKLRHAKHFFSIKEDGTREESFV